MRIGIITIHNSPNYGACLQAYALWKYISLQEQDCEIIDLYRPYQTEYVNSKRFSPMRQNNDLTSTVKHYIKQVFSLGKDRSKNNLFSDEAKFKFDKFNLQIKLSKSYTGIDELYATPPEYDLYISGSDQLWNPGQPYCLEPYFLTFAPVDCMKISYATSIGITNLTEREKNKFKTWLSSYTAISVREKQAKSLLESFIGRTDICQVPDPTFLLSLEHWNNIAIKPLNKEKYLLLFTLNWSQQLLEYSLRLCEECGLSLVVLAQKQPKYSGQKYIPVTDAGPKEFIGYIANADMVITDSFHGTVFSIIMGTKNFYTYVSPKNDRGSRITDILDSFGLQNHLLDTTLTASYPQLAAQDIDRNDILKKIELMKVQGKTFLDKFIK